MLEGIVLVAEILVIFWFAGFLTMMTSMYLDGRSQSVPPLKGAGRVLVSHARLAIIVGIISVIGMTLWEVGNAVSAGGLS
ncbi:hypothetical protein [Roseibium sediminis]|uniref:hypothetical protein n=1 Tax=Roseibium sediminis TaxID=1775174 RepID=UPI00123D6F9C|nr:hypothetical protein [Roseibium sediminis]